MADRIDLVLGAGETLCAASKAILSINDSNRSALAASRPAATASGPQPSADI
jgi:hypothetical protein